MESSEYLRLADACLGTVARWLEEFDPDEVDFSTGDGLLTVEFADGTRYVLNRQAATAQVWLAAGARAWHYRWDAGRQEWVDERDGHELFARIATVVGEKLGRSLSPPAPA